MNPEGGNDVDASKLRRPIIGIFTQPRAREGRKAYLPSSYVKWIESAGGKVIPIHFDLPESKIEELFMKVNGILLPGGGHSLKRNTTFMRANLKILELAKRENEKNNFFPIFGTCQGFQILSIIAPDVYKEENEVSPMHGPKDVLFVCKGTRRSSLPLKFVDSASPSKMLSPNNSLGQIFREISSKENVTLNSHKYGVDLKTWKKIGMGKYFNIIANSFDTSGKEFIGIFEHKSHPIYSVQFHPEKVPFEDKPLQVNQSLHSNLFNNYLASFFVEEARKSDHCLKSPKDEELLIDNFTPVKDTSNYFRTVYLFDLLEK